MSGFRLAPEAEAELDEIWLYIARESGSIDVATGGAANHGSLLALGAPPVPGRARDKDLGPGLRSFPVDDYLIIHRIAADEAVLILHIVRGRRDIMALFTQ